MVRERWQSSLLVAVLAYIAVTEASIAAPHFTSFSGVKYDFPAKQDTIYPLLSERHHQINALFTPSADHTQLYMTMIGLKYKDWHFKVQVTEVGKIKVWLNNEELAPGPEHSFSKLRDDSPYQLLSSTVEGAPAWLSGQTLKLTTDTFRIMVYSPDAAHSPPEERGAHLDLRIVILEDPPLGVHGILGQTYIPGDAAGAFPQASAMDAVRVEGVADDYVLSGLFTHDFAFNKFRYSHGGDTVGSTSRRLLRSGWGK